MRYFLEFIIEYEGKFASTEEKRLNYLNEYTRLLDTQEYGESHDSGILTISCCKSSSVY